MRRSRPVGKLFTSGAVVNGILGLMLVELLLLILVRKKMPSPPRPMELMVSIGAGAALLLALRAALRERAWPHVAVWLLVALGCHVADIRLRWASRRPG